MRKLCGLVIWNFVFAALTAGAASSDTIYCYYTKYTSSNGQTPDAVGTGIADTGFMTKSPSGSVFMPVSVNFGSSQAFAAHPEMGWKVMGWYSIPHNGGLGGALDKNTSPALGTGNTYTWVAGSSGGSYILTVFFEPISYKLTFDWSGMDSQTKKYDENVNLPSAARTGYGLVGWTNSDGSNFVVNATYTGESFGVTNDNQEVKLTPKWSEKSYAIATAGENCTVTVSPESSALYTDEVTISWSPSVEAGAQFTLDSVTVYGGTDTSGAELATYKSGTSATFKMSSVNKGYYADIYVKAVYRKQVETYGISVTAGENGSVEKSPDQSSLAYGTELTITAKANEGYAFQKWSDGSVESPRTLKVTGAVSLKASFTNCVYTLTFNPNGGELVGDETSRLVGYRDYIGELPDARQHLKSFKGWFNAPAGGTQITALSRYEWAIDATLYAQWEDAPAITIDVVADPPDGGVVSGGGTQFEKGDRTTLEATANAGYGFSHWSDGGAQSHEVDVVGNVKYTATFTGNWYTVSFNANGGSVAESSRDYQYGRKFESFPPASWQGHLLTGWFRKKSGGTQVTEDDKFDFADPDDQDFTLYAQWTVRPSYTVTYVCDQPHEGTMSDQTIYRDEEVALTSNAFARTGYTFLGWAVTNDLTKVKYADGVKVRNLAPDADIVELHAVWQANRFWVAFDGNGATEVAMDPVPFTYDDPKALPPNTFTRGELWSFDGWSNTVDGTVYADGETVSNLCAVADATNRLEAVWKSNLTDLSRAMHCDTLIWYGVDKGQGADWEPTPDGAVASSQHLFSGDNQTSVMVATGMVSGTLSFQWKVTSANAVLELQNEMNMSLANWQPAAAGDWNQVTVKVDLPEDGDFRIMKLRLNYRSDQEDPATVTIDNMIWTPQGAEPQQGDPVKATGVSVRDGKFVLSMPGENGIDYGVWTNADLLVPVESWGFMTNHVGGGTTFSFELPILPELPQLFYSTFKVK